MKSRFGIFALTLLLTATLLITGCGTTEPSDSTPQEPDDTAPPETNGITLQEMADDVTDGVGEATSITEGDPEQIVFVFEEIHTSALGHVEIAIMLNRLYASYDLRHVGLEGHPADAGPLDTSWSHTEPYYQPDQIITAREDVIVQMLEDGEINSAEMLGLVYYDALIHGTDDAELYNVEEDWTALSNTFVQCLYRIALAELSDAQLADWNALYDQEKYDEAFDFAFSESETAAELWARWNDSIDVLQDREVPAFLEQVKEEAEAAGMTISATDEANLAAFIDYFQNVAIPRGTTMAESMLDIVADYPGVPLAMIIGAAHTAHVAELLTEAGVSVVTARPLSMAEGNTAGTLSAEAYARKDQGLSVAPEGYLGSFLDGRRNPPPVVEEQWYILEQAIKIFAQHVAVVTAELAWDPDEYEPLPVWPEDVTNDEGIWSLMQGLKNNHDLVEDVSVTDVNNTPYGPMSVSFKVTLTDGRIIEGKTGYMVNSVEKPYVDLEERIQLSLDNLKQETQPAEDEPMTLEQICSTMETDWECYKEAVN